MKMMIVLKKVNQFKVAVVQAGSEVMDKVKGVKKKIKLIEEAGMNQAKIIVFPEVFIPAYPRGMSFGAIIGSRSDEVKVNFD